MRVGPYEILDEIGSGGGGVVYRARSDSGASLAVKILRRTDPAAIGRFERERRALERLGEAEGFVPLTDFGASPEGPWIAMPFVGGGTLRDRLRRGTVATEQALEWAREIARALGHAHALGIVHRDLKPENVLFTAEGRPLVADLGLAKHFVDTSQDGEPLSRTGDFRGTPGYCAPEQLTDSKSVTPAADVFALGSILFECLSGEPAFAGRTTIEIVQAELDGRHQPLSLVKKRAPRWVARIVARCLASSPQDRFEDGVALLRALAGPPARRPLRLVAPIVLAIALGAAFLLARRPRADDATALELARRSCESSRATRTDEARAEAERACALAPGRAETQVALALSLALGEKPDNAHALEAAKNALAIAPDSAVALALHGGCRVWQGDANGMRECDKAVLLAPREPWVWAIRGHAYEVTDDDAATVADETRALDCDRDFLWALIWRARAKGSAEDAARALALAPDSIACWIADVDARITQRDFDGAVAQCDRGLEKNKGSTSLRGLRAFANLQRRDVAGALAEIDRAIVDDPRMSTLYLVRSYIRLANDDREGAEKDARASLELAPDAMRKKHARAMLDHLRESQR